MEVSFEQAVLLTKAGFLDKAIDAWASLLEQAVQSHGDLHPEVGPLYYRYGDALLRKAEESTEVFSEEDDDVAIAFEVLECARLSLQGAEKASALLRLGDLRKLNNDPLAIEDYKACLALRDDLFEDTDRRIADVHWCLAVAYDFHKMEQAKDHYRKCADSLSKRAANLDPKDPELKELAEILDELKETLEAPEVIDDNKPLPPPSNIHHLQPKKR